MERNVAFRFTYDYPQVACTSGTTTGKVLFGHPREKVFSIHLWLRFATLWFVVVLVGFVEGYVLLPFGIASFLGSVFLTVFVIWRVAPKWLG